MFSFLTNKKNTLLSSVDIHSHLIPGIDDGSNNMETSIQLIKELKSIGYKKLITTPHVSDMFPNTTSRILEGFDQLKKEVAQQEIDIELEISAEYYADDFFEKLLSQDDILSFGEKKYLLFETSYFTPPQNIFNTIHDIQLSGYTPVLAHPERYLYWHHDFSKYHELKERGLLFQINLNSISGYYNKEIQIVVEKLINNSLVDFVGSDTHHHTHIKKLKTSISSSFYKKAFKKNIILNETLR